MASRKKHQLKLRKRQRQARLQRYFRARGEMLEDRRMLAAVVTAASAGAFGALADFLDGFVDVDDILPEVAQQRLSSPLGSGETLTYQAYAGESNEVTISQQFGDFFYVIDEGNDDVPVVPVPLAFNPEVINDIGTGFSFVVEVTVDIGDLINLPDATAIVPNATSILSLLPGIGGQDGILAEMTNTLGEGLTFGLGEIVSFIGDGVEFIQDALNTAIGPIISAVGDVVSVACDAIDAIPFVNPDCDDIGDFSEDLLQGLANDLNPLPDIPTELLNLGVALIDGLTSTFTTNSVVVSTLDGNDTIDLRTLRGVDQIVFAGSQDDHIISGGGEGSRIELYGEEGRDTFELNLIVDVPIAVLDGGPGNDIISILGTEGNDTFRIRSLAGSLHEIILEAPNPNANQQINEQQTIVLPSNTTGGSFILGYQGLNTPPLSANSDAATIETALNALPIPGFNPGDIDVSGSVGGPFTVTFTGTLGNQDVKMLSSDGGALILNGGMGVTTIREADPNLGTNEQQTVALPTETNGGDFTLTFNGATSAPIAFDASAPDVLQALLDLSTIPAGAVDVTGPVGGPWSVEFQGALGGSNQPALTADGTNLTSRVIGDVVVSQQAVPAINEIQRVSLPAGVTGGIFQLVFSPLAGLPETTAPIPVTASVSEVQAALHALSASGNPSNIVVTGTTGGPWDIEFTGDLRGRDIQTLGVISDDVRGGVTVDVIENTQGSGTNEIQLVTTNGATGGTFTLTFDNQQFARTTANLPFDATAGEIQTALESLTSLGAGNVVVSGPVGGPWQVEFIGDLAAQPQLPLLMDGANMTGGFVSFSSNSVETVAGDAGTNTNEVQTLWLTPQGAATDGTFVLRLNATQTGSITTAPIAFDADAAAVEAALIAAGLSGVSVSGNSQGPFTFTFDGGALAATNIDRLIFADVSGLTGNVSELQTAVAGSDEVQTIDPQEILTGGEFRLSLNGDSTPSLPYNASASEVQAALEQLGSIGSGNVLVVKQPGGEWIVTFTGTLSKTDVNSLAVDADALAGALTVQVNQQRAATTIDVNEKQLISLTPTPDAGGTFRLTYNGATTADIPYPASATQIELALESLPTIDGNNVAVTGGLGGPWEVEFINELRTTNRPSINVLTDPAQGFTGLIRSNLTPVITDDAVAFSGTNEQQRVSLPFGVTGGDFTLTFNGQTTAPISYNASRTELQSALESTLGAGNVVVFGPQKGPWTVEFTGALGLVDQPLLVADDAGLIVNGGALSVSETRTGSDGGETVIVATTTFDSVRSIEQIRVEGGGGVDRIVIEGALDEIAEIIVDGGSEIDILELVSDSNNGQRASFTAPVFPDGTQARVDFDGQAVEFSDIEGGLTFDANGKAGIVSVSGTDEANDIRFSATDNGSATFANDGQVTINLKGFAGPSAADPTGSTIEILGQQGDDIISVAPNGFRQFASFTLDGGAPAGANTVRFEGTRPTTLATGADQFIYTPDSLAADSGNLAYDLGAGTSISMAFSSFAAVAIVGLGGDDKLTVNEPTAGSNDTVLYYPGVDNNGAFQFTSRSGGPGTSVVSSRVEYSSIEERIFDTGSGVDTLSLSTDDLPGVNSQATINGGINGTTVVAFGDQQTTFLHDVDPQDPDTIALEIGTANDVVTAQPGRGIKIVINTALGDDRVFVNGVGTPMELDVPSARIRFPQTDFGDVLFSNSENVHIEGLGNDSLTVHGGPLENRFAYTPLTENGGQFASNVLPTTFSFDNIGGTLLLIGNALSRDEVHSFGSTDADRITVDAVARTVATSDIGGAPLKTLTLDPSIERVTIDAAAGDDRIFVRPGIDLWVSVNGNGPNASDRLLIEDTGLGDLILQREAADGRSGSVTVGALLPVDYENLERVDVFPLDAETGGTGADGLGRLVVFDADPFEHNQSLPNRTDFSNLFVIPSNPNIDPSIEVGSLQTGPSYPADEDWYRFDATQTATLRFELLFEAIGTLGNGNPGLPGDGELQIEVYDPSNSLIPKIAGESAGSHTIGVEQGQTYSIRVRGVTTEAINLYDIRVTNLDEIGPQITDVYITNDLLTVADESTYNLFEIKPSQGPTPLVRSLTIDIQDLTERFPGFLYDALNQDIASAVGQYRVVGDHNGIIPIESVDVFNAPVTIGQLATAKITLHFAEPLPDDRFTLTVLDNLVDPVGNRLDGESNASEPQANPLFPTGDSVARGNFVARFTVDSRAEIGAWALGSAHIDTNGNFLWDPENQFSDDTNEDIVYKLGFQTDSIFAGDFVAGAADTADGFDKLAAYGQVAGLFRWLIDTNHNGVPDLVVADPAQVNGRPVAGNFDGNRSNGDEVGLKEGTTWHLDTDHDFQVDFVVNGDLVGLPVVGDFDGDGLDDLGAWADDIFSLDLSGDGLDGFGDLQFRFGFPGVREIPVAADFNGDGIDDLGLWNPDAAAVTPSQQSDWFVLMSQIQPNEMPTPTAAELTFGNSTTINTTGGFRQFFGDDYLPVDPTRSYVLAAQARSGDDVGGQYNPANQQYFGFASWDADRLFIDRFHYQKFPSAADTRLAVDLKPGDTSIQLVDATGWANAQTGNQRTFAWYGYANSSGYVYPDYTYTRNVEIDAWAPGAINGNTITLRTPWSGPLVTAGTAVRNADSGPTYNYAVLSRESVPDQWTEYQSVISGTGNAPNQFRPGTAFIKPVILANWHGSGNQIRFRGLNLTVADRLSIPITERVTQAADGTQASVVNFVPQPFGQDLYASFGDEFALPIVGNFDPPVTPTTSSPSETVATTPLKATNPEDAHDVDGNGRVTPLDALAVINFINRHGAEDFRQTMRIEVDSLQLGSQLMLDVNADGLISALDALKVVNQLNRNAQDGAQAEGEDGGSPASFDTNWFAATDLDDDWLSQSFEDADVLPWWTEDENHDQFFADYGEAIRHAVNAEFPLRESHSDDELLLEDLLQPLLLDSLLDSE